MSTSSRPRTSGVSTAAGQQQQPAQNFKPKSEWKQEDDASFLVVYLPGFQLEQLTVTPDYANRTVRVEGKRRLPNNRLLPVDETYSIPEDCELSKMDKQLGSGILMLKMPRNVVIPQPVTEEKNKMAAGKSDDEKVAERRKKNDGASGDGKPGREETLLQNDEVKEEQSKAESKGMKEPSMTSAISVAKVEEKEKKNRRRKGSLKLADAEGKEAEKENANASAKKGMVKGLNGDTKLMVNMFAAVLIIVGLAVSLVYTFSQKPVG